LVILTSKTSRITRHISTQTVTTYRCTNVVCQEEIDRRIEEISKFHHNQAILKAKRLGIIKNKLTKQIS